MLLRVCAVFLDQLGVETFRLQNADRQVRAANGNTLLLMAIVGDLFHQRVLDVHLTFGLRLPERNLLMWWQVGEQRDGPVPEDLRKSAPFRVALPATKGWSCNSLPFHRFHQLALAALASPRLCCCGCCAFSDVSVGGDFRFRCRLNFDCCGTLQRRKHLLPDMVNAILSKLAHGGSVRLRRHGDRRNSEGETAR